MYLYALAAGGQKGVERALGNLKKEIETRHDFNGCLKYK